MDIGTALQRMNSPVLMTGESHLGLVAKVQDEQRKQARDRSSKGRPSLPSKTLTPADGLSSGSATVRPIDALLRLSLVTALTVADDVYALYKHWGWLRYLGAFDHLSHPRRLTLDRQALEHVHANQRRVLSEDLGIGFGVLLAEKWCRASGALDPIRTTDIDKVLRNSRQFPGLTPNQNSTRQPDYLMQFASASDPSAIESRLLETKGTANASNAISQLAYASTQIASLLLDGSPIQGVAISTISTVRGVKYLAIDPPEKSDPWIPEDEQVEKAKRNAPRFDESEGILRADKNELLASATVTANATLADFAGLDEVATKWLPDDRILRTRRPRQIRSRSLRGSDYVGSEFSIAAPGIGGRLTVFQGVTLEVEEALQTGDDTRVRGAQDSFLRRNRPTIENADVNGEMSQQETTAISGEGAILHIELDD